MPYAMTPPGYQAHLLGSGTSLEELSGYVPLEEGLAEGSLVLMRLDFEGYPSAESLADLNTALIDEGVLPWLGYDYIVYADAAGPSVYLAWVKADPWLNFVIGLLAITVLPVLLMAFVWWILPESITAMIEAMFMFGMMLLVMFMMMKMVRPLTEPERPKGLEKR